MTHSSIRPDLKPEQFMQLFLQKMPLLDVRAPVEFAAGAFPASVNRPLLDDEQRHLVGTEYARHGQDAAIDLGKRLATEDIRAQRMASWQEFVTQHPGGYLYCFRGGLRSRITQQWLAEAGYEYPLITGGYKAMRGFLLSQLERLCDRGNIIVLSGATGVGKTELIDKYASAIDLEGRANHRGSAFGRTFTDQPSQIDWENRIIIDWLRCEAASDRPVLIEAESHLIGRIHLPAPLQEAMSRAPVLVLQANLQQRTERLFNDYVVHTLHHYQHADQSGGQNPWFALQDNILHNLQRIKKRLGGLRYQQLGELLPHAVEQLRKYDDRAGFERIIKLLLENYYDDLYRHHMDRNQPRVQFTGNRDEIRDWLKRNPHCNGDARPVVKQSMA